MVYGIHHFEMANKAHKASQTIIAYTNCFILLFSCHYIVNVNGGSNVGGSTGLIWVQIENIRIASIHTSTQYRSVLIQTGPGGATGFYMHLHLFQTGRMYCRRRIPTPPHISKYQTRGLFASFGIFTFAVSVCVAVVVTCSNPIPNYNPHYVLPES